MKRKLSVLVLLVTMVFGATRAQQLEPEFVGEVNYLKSATSVVPLEKQRSVLKTKAGASVYLTGLGKVKSKINIAGGSSPVRVAATDAMQFIVRAVDNNSDPMSIVNVFRFKANSKARKAEVSSASSFGGVSENNLDYIPFTAKKYGENSYLITLTGMQAGEYGITVSNPNAKDEKSLIVSCFGVD